jgi:hypothetical protein
MQILKKERRKFIIFLISIYINIYLKIRKRIYTFLFKNIKIKLLYMLYTIFKYSKKFKESLDII